MPLLSFGMVPVWLQSFHLQSNLQKYVDKYDCCEAVYCGGWEHDCCEVVYCGGWDYYFQQKRYNIIIGITQGLFYLHEDSRLRIIHQDIKASNILLDKDLNPKIVDFSLARPFEKDETFVGTGVSGTRWILERCGYINYFLGL